MLNLDPEKLLVIGILALVVLGPNRLPGAARSLGRVIGQLRRMSGSLQSEVSEALAEPRQALQHAMDEFGIGEVRSSVSAATDPFRASSVLGRVASPHPLAPGGDVPPSPGKQRMSLPAAGEPLVVPDDPALN